jgi:hypothetical protein
MGRLRWRSWSTGPSSARQSLTFTVPISRRPVSATGIVLSISPCPKACPPEIGHRIEVRRESDWSLLYGAPVTLRPSRGGSQMQQTQGFGVDPRQC